MQIVLLLSILIGCSSFTELNQKNSEDEHSSVKITYHQMGLDFIGQSKRLSKKNEDELNTLSQKVISTSQPIKQIRIYSNPKSKDQLPKEELLNNDRAVNAKRFLERELHSQSKIEITSDEKSPYQYEKNADILILIEYL